MRLQNALKLHNEDEVIVKINKRIMKIVDIKIVKEKTTDNISCVNLLLEDGNWYGYREVI